MEEQIKQIVREEANNIGLDVCHGSSYIIAYAKALLARIDAERGEAAAGWVSPWSVRNLLRGCRIGGAWISPRRDDDDSLTVPLFLFPTIPEGMALVKRAVLRDRGFANGECGLCIPTVTVQFSPDDWSSRDAFAGEMLAAAQGERK